MLAPLDLHKQRSLDPQLAVVLELPVEYLDLLALVTHLVNLKALESLNVKEMMSAKELASACYLYSGKLESVLEADYVNLLDEFGSQTVLAMPEVYELVCVLVSE